MALIKVMTLVTEDVYAQSNCKDCCGRGLFRYTRPNWRKHGEQVYARDLCHCTVRRPCMTHYHERYEAARHIEPMSERWWRLRQSIRRSVRCRLTEILAGE